MRPSDSYASTATSRANPRLGARGVAPTRATAVRLLYAGTVPSRANPRLEPCGVAPTRASAVLDIDASFLVALMGHCEALQASKQGQLPLVQVEIEARSAALQANRRSPVS